MGPNYGGLRPGEALQLRKPDLVLPAEGWGAPAHRIVDRVSGAYYADTADRARPLKRRRPEDVRPVPIPPALVAVVRERLAEFDTAPDGRLFPAAKTGKGVPASVYTRM